jgi:O-antigen chain-terminating methyltransferase
MTDSFYRAFEDKHRGPRNLIKERLEAYLPFLDAILRITNKPQAIDLGCGRGEWLEYLQGLGFNARGVELDEGMLEACQELGLSAKKGEMIEFIRTLPDASCMVVSAFHVVEHIRFEDVKIFVQEALRVLQPGGLLIMETPNPENIVVATRNFYLDPTHQNPIPPDLLHFVSEHAGFSRSKIVRLQEPPELREKPEVSIYDVFSGASPDYAVVAQKRATAVKMANFDTAFNRDYGLTLEHLIDRWDTRFSCVVHKLSHVEHAAEKGAKAYDAGLKDGVLQTQLSEAQGYAHDSATKIERLEAQIRQLLEKIGEIQAQIKIAHATREQKDNSLIKTEEKAVKLEQELKNTLVNQAITQTQKDALEAQAKENKVSLAAAMHAAEAVEKSQQRLKSNIDGLESELKQSKAELHEVHQSNHHHWSLAEERKQQLEELHQANHHHWTLSQERQQQLDEVHQANHHHWSLLQERGAQLHAVLNSKSWRITWPLRKLMQFTKWLLRLPLMLTLWMLALPKKVVRHLLTRLIRFATKHHSIRLRATRWLNKHPRIKNHVRLFAQRRGLLPGAPAELKPMAENAFAQEASPPGAVDLSPLTPRARQIYSDLKAAIEQNKGP